jgi:hypothetical protein
MRSWFKLRSGKKHGWEAIHNENARNVLQKLCQWLHCVVSQVVELVNQNLRSFIRDGRG